MKYIALFYRKTGKKIISVSKSESTKIGENKFRTEMKNKNEDIENH